MGGVVDTTIYRVDTVFGAKDEASHVFDGIDKHAAKAEHSTLSLSHALEAVGLGIGIHEAKKALIDFNEKAQNAKIGIAAMFEAGYGIDYQQATKASQDYYDEMQRFSTKLPVTTAELVEFGQGITIANNLAGGSIRDLTTMTEKGIVAAKSWGFETKMASMQITEMLEGNIRKTEKFTMALLGTAHISAEKWNTMTGHERLDALEKVFDGKALTDATAAFSTSFTGVISTFEDKVQILFGKIGLPLFNAITKEIGSWNDWLSKNTYQVDLIAKEVGSSLVDGFKTVKTVFEFLWDHREAFLAIAKAYAAIKIGGSLASFGTNLTKQLAEAGKSGSDSKMGIGAVGPATQALMGGYAIGTFINQQLGLSDSIAGVIRVNGELLDRTDRITMAYAKTVIQMNALDEAVERASSALDSMGKGAEVTQANKNLAGGVDYIREQANLLNQVYKDNKGIYEAAGHQMTNYATVEKAKGDDKFDVSMYKRAYADVQADYDKNPSRNVSPEQLNASQIMEHYARSMEQRGVMARAESQSALDQALGKLTPAQREMVDQQKVLNELMAKAVGAIASGGHLSQEDADKLVKAAQSDPTGRHASTQFNQFNNITVEVSAKDPDRWMTELDAKIRRKIRAPTTPRGAARTGSGVK